jgi:uncharacterized protein YbjT (DUF2867 family)/Fe2+ or Zn2+ uptake regulation protein
MYVIAGVTGHTGAATAESLLSRGHQVRAVVRSAEKAERWRRKGCEVVVADLADPAALASALEDAEGAWLLSPPNPAARNVLADRKAFLDRLVEGVKRSRVRNVAVLSSIGAQHPAGTGPIVTLHRAEQALRDIAPSVTFVRAAYFLENWESVIPVARRQGVLPHFGAVDVKFPQVCARDIGEAAADALVAAADGTRIVELAGEQDWSVEDVAAALGELLGTPVKAMGAPVDWARAGLEQAGVPPEMARLDAEMYAAIASGLVAFERPQGVTRGSTRLVEALRQAVERNAAGGFRPDPAWNTAGASPLPPRGGTRARSSTSGEPEMIAHPDCMTRAGITHTLAEHGIQPSAQRLAVAEYVLHTEEHPSADKVFSVVKERIPMISRATVYNTLNLFVEKRLLNQLVISEGRLAFDPRLEPHHHFIDERTGVILDVPWEAIEVCRIEALPGFDVREYQVILRGTVRSH